jgi:hypothetical protein
MFSVAYEMHIIDIDSGAVHDAIDGAERAQLPEIGQRIAEQATASIRFRGKTSRPGQTPTAHSIGRRSIRNIQSATIPSDHSVIVGSIGLASRGGKTVPQELEFGIRYAARPYMWPALQRVARGSTIRRALTDSMRRRS